MSKVLSDVQVLDNALVETRGSADLPEGAAAEEFAESVASAPEVEETPAEEVVEAAELPEGEEAPAAVEEQEEEEAAIPPGRKPGEAVKPPTAEEKAAKEKKDQEDEEQRRLEEDLNPNAAASMKGLFRHLDKDPAFKAAVEKNPGLKASLFRMGRMAERADKYDTLFHTPQMAQASKVAADEYFKMDDLFNAEDPAAFVRFLIDNSLEYDEKGDPMRHEDGRLKSTGAYENLARYWQSEWRKDVLGYAERISRMDHEQAKADGEELLEAMKVLDRVIFGKMQKPQQGVDENDPSLANLPPALRQEILDARRAKGAQSTSRTAGFETFKTNVDSAVEKMLGDYAEQLINQVLSKNQKAVLSPLSRKHIVAEVIQNVKDAEKANVAHSSTFKHLMKSTAQTAEGIQSLVNLKKAFYREILPGYLRNAFSDVTSATIKTAKARAGTIQAGQNKRDVPSTGRGIAPAGRGETKMDQAQATKVLADAEKAKGKPLSEIEKLDALLAAQGR